MKAVEFQATLKADRTLAIPVSAVDAIVVGQTVRVLILLPENDEDRDWERRAAEEFRRGYADTDALYDQGALSQAAAIEREFPDDLAIFRLPTGVDARLQELLDRQDRGKRLNEAERKEAEGLVELAEFLTLLRLRAERSAPSASVAGTS